MGAPFFSRDGFELYHGDCLEVLPTLKTGSVKCVFADPPYRLSNDGISCRAGRMVSVNKGEWDRSRGFEKDYEFTRSWLALCREVLAPDGTIWVSGTMHNIYQVGHALQSLGFKILNEVAWYKPNAPPNLSCRYFTHSHETLLWAKKDSKARHTFNYGEMKSWPDRFGPAGKQMRSVWHIPLTPACEKTAGRHPTQKPLELLKRIIASSTQKGDLVLDPFNGSGTTGIAAHQLARRYLGIDRESTFLDLTVKRLKRADGQKTLSPN